MYYGPAIIMGTGIRIPGYEADDPEVGIILNMPLAFISAIGSIMIVFKID